jgi:hypothetical protein
VQSFTVGAGARGTGAGGAEQVVQICSGAVVQRCSGAGVPQWYSVQWYSGTYSGTYSAAVVQWWCRGAVADVPRSCSGAGCRDAEEVC